MRNNQLIVSPLTGGTNFRQTPFEWEIKETPIYDFRGNKIEIAKMLSRNDNAEHIAIVGRNYEPLTNEFFCDSVQRAADKLGAQVIGFDDFGTGRQVVAYLENEDSAPAGFTTKNYTVFGNGHDGSTPFFAGSSSKMLRCSNAFASIQQSERIKHSRNIRSNVEYLITLYEREAEIVKRQAELQEFLSYIPVNERQQREFMHELLQIPANAGAERVPRKYFEIEESIQNEARDMGELNRLSLFAGVTHYTTHKQDVRNDRHYNTLFGTISQLNKRAFNLLTADIV